VRPFQRAFPDFEMKVVNLARLRQLGITPTVA
jgi:hypothetical protein